MPGAFALCLAELRRMEHNKERINKRRLRDAPNPMNIPEERFVANFRINREAFSMILEDIAPMIMEGSIPATIKLAATLRFLAVGSYQGVVANDVNISIRRSTFSKILWNVMNALESKLCPKWINLKLTEAETKASKCYFFEKHGMPGVIGCVDGTHIRIIKPSSRDLNEDNGQDYGEDCGLCYNRKGYFSINVMIVCDYKMRILAVDGCRPGSCHDAFIWRMSNARAHYQAEHRNGPRNGWLLGDSGYGIEPFLLIPYKNPAYGSKEHIFNKLHCSTRNIVERTIGNIKSRFRCLQGTTLYYTPVKVVKMVNVCSALHNICKHLNVDMDESPQLDSEDESDGDDDDDDDDDDDIPVNGLLNQNEGKRIRDNIASGLIRNN